MEMEPVFTVVFLCYRRLNVHASFFFLMIKNRIFKKFFFGFFFALGFDNSKTGAEIIFQLSK